MVDNRTWRGRKWFRVIARFYKNAYKTAKAIKEVEIRVCLYQFPDFYSQGGPKTKVYINNF